MRQPAREDALDPSTSADSRAARCLRILRIAAFAAVLPAASPAQDRDAQAAPEAAQATAHEEAPADARQYPALNEIVVSDERGVPLAYPGGRDQVDEETLETYVDGTAGTLLRRLPGVYVLPENGNDARIHVGLRGNDPRRSALTALLVDGIPVAEAPYGNTDVDGLPIALERIWKVDVIRGGASVRYGPNAAGGVVNFITEPIPDDTLVRFGTRFGSNDDGAVWTTAGGTWDRLGVLATGVYKQGDGFRDRSDYEIADGSVKFAYALSERETLSGSVSRFDEPKSHQAGGLTQAAYDKDPWQSLRFDNYFTLETDRYVVQYENRIDPVTDFQLLSWFQQGSRVLADVRPVVAPFTEHRVQNSGFSSAALEARYAWETEAAGATHHFYHSARYLMETNDVLYVRSPLPSGPITTPHELDADFKGHAFSVFNEKA